jgi:hypothetical protein
MKATINLDTLRERNRMLYNTVCDFAPQTFGTVKIEIPEWVRDLLVEDAKPKQETPVYRPTASKEPEPVVDEAALQIEAQRAVTENLEAEKKEQQRGADAAAGAQRLREYQAGGLEDTSSNARLIDDFIRAKTKGSYLSREIIDVCISTLGPKGTRQLTFRKPAPPPAPPAEPAAELLPNGEPRLPLGTQPSKEHSVAQLRDLDQRTRKPRRLLGGFTSRF